jgi:hypothetical protein
MCGDSRADHLCDGRSPNRGQHRCALGHSKLETTQIYAESSAEMIKESYQRARAG